MTVSNASNIWLLTIHAWLHQPLPMLQSFNMKKKYTSHAYSIITEWIWDDGRDDVTSWCKLILEKLVLMQLVRIFPAFMNNEDLTPCSKNRPLEPTVNQLHSAQILTTYIFTYINTSIFAFKHPLYSSFPAWMSPKHIKIPFLPHSKQNTPPLQRQVT